MILVGVMLRIAVVLTLPLARTPLTPPPDLTTSFQMIHRQLPDNDRTSRDKRSLEFASNTFLLFIEQLRLDLNASNCWLCAQIPLHALEGIPMFATPLAVRELRAPFYTELPKNATWAIVSRNVSEYIHIRTPPPALFCLQCNGTGQAVGTSTCNTTVVKNGITFNLNHTFVPNLTPAYYNLTGFYHQAFIYTHTCASGVTALVGHYFICGNRAYKHLPADFQGSCFIGTLFPAIRVSSSLPQGPIRDRRDITEAQRFWGITIPGLGVGFTMRELKRISTVLEVVANLTTDTFQTVAIEMSNIRQMVLQNRMALDFTLASKGGVCALIKDECCTFIPDNTDTIFQNTLHLQAAVAKLHETDNWDFLSWLDHLLPDVPGWIRYLLLLVVAILLALGFVFLLCKLFCWGVSHIFAGKPKSLPQSLQMIAVSTRLGSAFPLLPRRPLVKGPIRGPQGLRTKWHW
uniref:Envelope protein n=1 Tax=Sphenodon punctatus TaxID=8508 RepID=A0A8D0GVU4_SPHPU